MRFVRRWRRWRHIDCEKGGAVCGGPTEGEDNRMSTLAVIPARGGSKGIPRKNVALLAGRPMVAWTIDAARGARRVDRVVVSTDDAEIASVSRQWGAEVVMRPAELSGDAASSESALRHVLDSLRESEGYEPELLVFLQCTSPLTLAEDIDGVVERLLESGADTALSVTPFHYFLWREGAGGEAEGVNHEKARRPLRQDREPQYLETGAVYAMRTAGFREAGHRFFGKTVMQGMPAERCGEVDEPEDLVRMDERLRAREAGRWAEALPDAVGAVVFDFDGVFTDNRVAVCEDGTERVSCSRGDGIGIAALQRNCPDIHLLVLSSEENGVVSARCGKLGLECLQGVERKAPALEEWLKSRGVSAAETVYVGNDVNDLECMACVGCGLAVCDAHPDALARARALDAATPGLQALQERLERARAAAH